MANAAANAAAIAAANADAATTNDSLVATLQAQVKALTIQLGNNNNLPTGAPVVGAHANATCNCRPRKIYMQAEALAKFDLTGYCSTHGYWVEPGHNSTRVGGQISTITRTRQGRIQKRDVTETRVGRQIPILCDKGGQNSLAAAITLVTT
jgi:hypothetical protein